MGIKGSLEETKDFLEKIDEKLASMGLALSKAKTKVTNLNTSKVTFLGTNIFRAREVSYSRKSDTSFLVRNSRKLRLEAPLKRILSKLHDTNFMENSKSTPKFV